MIPYDDDNGGNALASSQTSNVQCGSVFSSSTCSDDENSPPFSRRKNVHSGDYNPDFEFIEREIGMCRPVS